MSTDNAGSLLRISAARLIAIESQPYLASALFAMSPRLTRALPHIATDEKWRIYFNPDVVGEQTANELAGVWLHQLAHCLRGHAGRFKALGEPPSRSVQFQRAADAVINLDLRDSGITIPRHFETLKDLRKMGFEIPEDATSEMVFRAITERKNTPADATGSGRATPGGSPIGAQFDCGSCCDGQRRDYEEPVSKSSEVEIGEAVSYDRAESIRAHTAVQIRDYGEQGNRVSKAYRRWAHEFLEPAVDWRDELASLTRRDVAQRIGRRTHSYSHPSRRQSAISGTGQGIILPAMREQELPVVAVVVDTSASMDTKRIDLAVAEIRGILEALGSSEKGIVLISCDASARVSRVKQMSEINLLGGGGTDMRIGIQLALSQKPRPQLIIVITDGETPWPPEPENDETVVAVLTEKNGQARVPSWIRSVYVLESTG